MTLAVVPDVLGRPVIVFGHAAVMEKKKKVSKIQKILNIKYYLMAGYDHSLIGTTAGRMCNDRKTNTICGC